MMGTKSSNDCISVSSSIEKKKVVTMNTPSTLARYSCASLMVAVFAIWGQHVLLAAQKVQDEEVALGDGCKTTTRIEMHSIAYPIAATLVYAISLPLLRKFSENYLSKVVDVKLLLKDTMLIYNGGQVLLNMWMVWSFFYALWYEGHPFVGGDVDGVVSGANFAVWVHYCGKYLELFDTFFMVLRGRLDQASFLQIYHHTTILWAWFVGMHLHQGGDAYFGALLNSIIHVLMYSYYILKLFNVPCPRKKYLTQAQMIQFVTVLVYSAVSCGWMLLSSQHKATWKHYVAHMIQDFEMISLFVLFTIFYKKSYQKKQTQQKEEQKDMDKWLKTFDYEGFSSEIRALGMKLEAQQGKADVAHLEKMLLWSNVFAAVGLFTMGFSINILTIFCLSTSTFTRWTIIAHHTCHGAFDKCHPNNNNNNSKRWHRFKFALGSLWRRFFDWFDWMMPEAWNVEHNNRHHYHLGEMDDPDLVEENLKVLRELSMPLPLKYLMVFFIMITWKWYYYAPNTYKELKLAKLRKEGKPIPSQKNGVVPHEPMYIKSVVLGQNPFYSAFEFFTVVVGPYFVYRFFITPLPFLFLGKLMMMDRFDGPTMYMTAVVNLVLAEFLTNAHAFLCVVTNHAGDDLYRFRRTCRPFSGSFYLRQVLSSTDYYYGTDLLDFIQGFLCYQVEHHMWPNLTMLSYRKGAPMVRDICERYGVPYVQHNVFWRWKKTVDIMVGSASMKWFPEYYENLFLEKDAAAGRAEN